VAIELQPLEQFTIERLVPLHIGRLDVSFTNSALMMTIAVVLITAPQRILAARLATRDRGSDGDVATRVARSANLKDTCQADHVIHNVGPPTIGIRRLVDVIRSP